VDSSDSLFVHDAATGMIYGFDSQGTETTFVGLRPCCRIAARWRRHPYGGLYFADYDNGTIVKYHPHGVATTVAVPGKLDHPVGLTYLLGEVLVAETGTKNDVGAIYCDGTVGPFSGAGFTRLKLRRTAALKLVIRRRSMRLLPLK